MYITYIQLHTFYILFTLCKHVPIKTNLHICDIYKKTYM
jgi:hypothetical protein